MKTFWIALFTLGILNVTMFVPLPFLSPPDKALMGKVEEYSKTAGLDCKVEASTIYSRISAARGIKSSVICRDPNFTFSNHRDGTSKTEVSAEFLSKIGRFTEEFWQASTDVAVGFLPAGASTSLTCYFPNIHPISWYRCKSSSCGSCDDSYPVTKQ